MSEKNVWSNFNFTTEMTKSAFDYLVEQSNGLTSATKGVLTMEVEALDVIDDSTGSPHPAALYTLYIVSPPLGNYRKKIITVLDNAFDRHFPVDIYSNVEDRKILNVSEDDFLTTIEEILSRKTVKSAIEELYKLSYNVAKDNRADSPDETS